VTELESGSVDPRLDRAHCARVVTRALQLPGGSELVTGSLSGLPGAIVRRRRFKPTTVSVQIADWRYEPEPSGRLTVAHVVRGSIVSENVLPPPQAGAHIAMALSRQLAEYGPRVLPDILALLEGLTNASD
jgi:hypothetical protein